MRLMTWNINGLRSFKISLKSLLDSLDCDIICFQETKVTREHLEEHLAIVEGYNSYFSFSKVKAGYSGVATFVRDECTPWLAEEGLSGVGKGTGDDRDATLVGHHGAGAGLSPEELERLDGEGRCVLTEHEVMNAAGESRRLVVINVYCPRADPDNEERLRYKLDFYRLLQSRAEELLRAGRNVIVLGDINTCHKPIDHCDPSEEQEFQSNPCRQWMNSFVCDPCPDLTPDKAPNSPRFADVLRIFHPDTKDLFTNWCSSTGARATNYGTRIDYIFADRGLALEDNAFVDCRIRPEIAGSDHCPVVAELSCVALAAFKCPSACTKYMPQFSGRQRKLSDFLFSRREEEFLGAPRDEGISRSQLGKVISDEVRKDSKKPTSRESRARGTGKSSSNMSGILKYFSGCKQPSLPAMTPIDNDVKDTILLNSTSSQPQSSCSQDSWLSSSSSHASYSSSSQEESVSVASVQRQLWSKVLTGPPKPPLCRGHGEPCILRSVKRSGPNKGRSFWVCGRPEGHRTNSEARCNHFAWVK